MGQLILHLMGKDIIGDWECMLPMDSKLALKKLLSDLQPHMGTRKCRPDQLFRFATRNRLWREERIRKRSSLVTGPSHSGFLSILISLRGAEITI